MRTRQPSNEKAVLAQNKRLTKKGTEQWAVKPDRKPGQPDAARTRGNEAEPTTKAETKDAPFLLLPLLPLLFLTLPLSMSSAPLPKGRTEMCMMVVGG